MAFDTTSDLFRLSGTDASLSIGGFLDLSGDLSFTASGTGADRKIEVGVVGTAIEAAAILYADGTFAAGGIAGAELPGLVEGLELSGDLTLMINTSGREDIDETDVGGTTVDLLFGVGEGHLIHAEGTRCSRHARR